AFFYYHINEIQAVRAGPWKLYLSQAVSKGGSNAPKLYNLVDDPQETTNLAGEQAERVSQLEALIDGARKDLGELDRPGPHIRPVGRFENPTPRVVE
ncbi:MAG: sulfatase family protein, partial [Thermoguttaceae bacterium]